MKNFIGSSFLSLGLCAATSCGQNTDPGTASLFVEAEDTITEGLTPGPGLENLRDEWKVSYEKFVIVLGNARASQGKAPSTILTEPRLFVIDMKKLPAAGLLLAQWKDVEATRWDKVGYDQGYASATSLKAPTTSQEDFDLMVSAGHSIYLSGSLIKGARTVKFTWGLKAGVAWNDCGPAAGAKGFAVPSGGTVQVKATVHGDHWFFNNFPEGEEKTERRAQWIADVDDMTGKDGVVTTDDLAKVPASSLFLAPTYSLKNALNEPINTALDFVVTQARTIGNFQGEGECGSLVKL